MLLFVLFSLIVCLFCTQNRFKCRDFLSFLNHHFCLQPLPAPRLCEGLSIWPRYNGYECDCNHPRTYHFRLDLPSIVISFDFQSCNNSELVKSTTVATISFRPLHIKELFLVSTLVALIGNGCMNCWAYPFVFSFPFVFMSTLMNPGLNKK